MYIFAICIYVCFICVSFSIFLGMYMKVHDGFSFRSSGFSLLGGVVAGLMLPSMAGRHGLGKGSREGNQEEDERGNWR